MTDRCPAAPSAAERARTLAAGVVPGVLRLLPSPFSVAESSSRAELGRAGAAAGPGSADVDGGARAGVRPTERARAWRVQHLCDRDGRLSLLVADDGELGRELQGGLDRSALPDLQCLLDVLDVPPGPMSLPRARLCVTGWAGLPSVPEQRRRAEQICAVRPIGSLLDVGATCSLWRFDAAEIRLTTAHGIAVVRPRDFAHAEPDPLYAVEDHIVAHLQEEHLDDAIRYAFSRLEPAAARQVSDVNVVGVDRYGLDLLVVVGGDYRAIRAPFASRVRDERSLSAALTALFRPPAG